MAPNTLVVLDFVLRHGTAGVHFRDVARVHGHSDDAAGQVLRRLRKHGLVECSHPSGTHANRWGAPGTHAARLADVAAMAAAKRARNTARLVRKAKSAAAKRARIAEEKAAAVVRRLMGDDCDEVDDKPFRHLLVSALDVPPLGRVGPASVWELAA